MKDHNRVQATSKTVYEDSAKIRNSVFRIDPARDRFNLIVGCTDPNGEIVIENCIIDGGGIFTHPSYHKGRLIIKNCYIKQSPNNGLYADSPTGAISGRQNHGGTTHVRNCYFENNNISHVRLNVGSSVKNTVIRNTDEYPVPHTQDSRRLVNSRGLHTFYGASSEYEHLGQPVAENVHVDVREANTNNPESKGLTASAFRVDTRGKNAPNPVWQVKNSNIRGPISDESRISRSNVGQSPSVSTPSGVPLSDNEALNGNAKAQANLETEPAGLLDASGSPGFFGLDSFGSGGSADIFLPDWGQESAASAEQKQEVTFRGTGEYSVEIDGEITDETPFGSHNQTVSKTDPEISKSLSESDQHDDIKYYGEIESLQTSGDVEVTGAVSGEVSKSMKEIIMDYLREAWGFAMDNWKKFALAWGVAIFGLWIGTNYVGNWVGMKAAKAS